MRVWKTGMEALVLLSRRENWLLHTLYLGGSYLELVSRNAASGGMMFDR